MERAEKYGLGLAAAGHVLLFGLLSAGFLATPNPLKLETKPIDISLVEDVAVEAAAPASTEAPESAQAPDTGPVEDAAPPAETVTPPEPAPPQPAPEPAPPAPKAAPAPKPQPKAPPKPAPAPKPVAKAPPAKPAPPQPKAAAKAAPAKQPARPAPAQARPRPDRLASLVAGARGGDPAAKAARPRAPALGDDFRKSLALSEARGKATAPRAANVSATAVAGLGDAIARQVQPCANRIPNPGPGANQIRSRLRLRMKPDGTLSARPALMGQAGVTEENGRYAARVAELATSAIIQCAPYELPAELYKGGWEDIIVNYRLPG